MSGRFIEDLSVGDSAEITRIVTAPFRALAALFGSGSETLGDILFDPGSARLLPTEQEKQGAIPPSPGG